MASLESKLIVQERKQSSFSIKEMTYLIDGGKHKTALRHDIENVILHDSNMKVDNVSCMSWEQQQAHDLKRMIYFYTTLVEKKNWDYTTAQSPEVEFLPRVLGLSTALTLHAGAFVPSIVSLGSKEQIEKWYLLSKNFHVIGCYAQTELGHGTNLQGLETTATYDLSDQTFVLNCPTLTSMKWWPGEIGNTANHAIVMAQLYVGEISYGMHAFIVQIRDLSTHLPMTGITVGSIGPTMMFGGLDNGFLKLSNVKIPRENMLAKYSEVLPNGSYVKKGNEKLMYASMVNLRVLMTKDEAVLALQKSCTIAARYSCVRRQGSLNPGKSEIQIIDFVAQQHKILPQIAAAYAFHFTIKNVLDLYIDFLNKLDQGIVSNLSELHFITAGTKAMLTEMSVEGIEILRRSCGGHGFSHSSGMPKLLTRATASCTYEGENTVMYLQCARFLLKCAARMMMNKPLSNTVQYLTHPIKQKSSLQNKEDFFDLKLLSQCFKHRVQVMLRDITSSMQSLVADGKPEMEVWNLSSIRLIELSKAHMHHFVLSCFIQFIEDSSSSHPVREVLKKLCALYGVHQININAKDFLKDGFLSGSQCVLSEEAEVTLFGMLRNDVVALVDAFDFRDEILMSCLGCYDGNVYQRLFDHVQKLPINQKPVHEEIYNCIRPYLLVGRDELERITSKL